MLGVKAIKSGFCSSIVYRGIWFRLTEMEVVFLLYYQNSLVKSLIPLTINLNFAKENLNQSVKKNSFHSYLLKKIQGILLVIQH